MVSQPDQVHKYIPEHLPQPLEVEFSHLGKTISWAFAFTETQTAASGNSNALKTTREGAILMKRPTVCFGLKIMK